MSRTGLFSYRGFEQAALGKGKRPESEAKGAIADAPGPVLTDPANFAFQSYFDSTLYEKALQVASANEPIIRSTRIDRTNPGYAVQLHAGTQCPIAIIFQSGAQGGQSSAHILKPGEFLRPFGKPGDRDGSFSGYSWGLPMGWLGGGIARLLVFTSPDARGLAPGGDQEIIYHRLRQPIVQTLPAAARKNWPMRFPWTQALSGSSSLKQQGKGLIAITPTKTAVTLRPGTGTLPLVNPITIRAIMQGTRDVGLDNADNVVLTNPVFEDFSFAPWTNVATGGGNLATQDPSQILDSTHPLTRFAADDGGVCFAEPTGAAGFANLELDIVRYGTIG